MWLTIKLRGGPLFGPSARVPGWALLTTEMDKTMSEEKKPTRPPIKSGWRGNLSGAVEDTKGTEIHVSEITLRLDSFTAWALANQLTDRAINDANAVENEQIAALSTLGAAIGRLIDHPAANNGGRECIK